MEGVGGKSVPSQAKVAGALETEQTVTTLISRSIAVPVSGPRLYW